MIKRPIRTTSRSSAITLTLLFLAYPLQTQAEERRADADPALAPELELLREEETVAEPLPQNYKAQVGPPHMERPRPAPPAGPDDRTPHGGRTEPGRSDESPVRVDDR